MRHRRYKRRATSKRASEGQKMSGPMCFSSTRERSSALQICGAERGLRRCAARDSSRVVYFGRDFDGQAVALRVACGNAAHHHRNRHEITDLALAEQELRTSRRRRLELGAVDEVPHTQRHECALPKTHTANPEQHVGSTLPEGFEWQHRALLE